VLIIFKFLLMSIFTSEYFVNKHISTKAIILHFISTKTPTIF